MQAVADYTGQPVEVTLESVERYGMAKASAIVKALGMSYDPSSRRWLVPVGELVEVRV